MKVCWGVGFLFGLRKTKAYRLPNIRNALGDLSLCLCLCVLSVNVVNFGGGSAHLLWNHGARVACELMN